MRGIRVDRHDGSSVRRCTASGHSTWCNTTCCVHTSAFAHVGDGPGRAACLLGNINHEAPRACLAPRRDGPDASSGNASTV